MQLQKCDPDSGVEQAPRWHALYLRHQHEKAAADILSTKGFQVFLPTYHTVHRWKDRNKQLTLPLFPGYLFFADGLDRRLQIVTTPGVCAIVGTAGVPAVIPSEEIDSIRRAVESYSRMEPHPFLTHGNRVRVKFGPLAGIEGILVRKKHLFRFVLSVQMLGRSAAVEIDASIVERVYSPQAATILPRTRAGLPVLSLKKESLF